MLGEGEGHVANRAGWVEMCGLGGLADCGLSVILPG